MPSFKATVHKHRKNKDGSYNLVIRVTHRRESSYLTTQWSVRAHDIDPMGNIRNIYYSEKCDQLIQYYQQLCLEIEDDIQDMDAKGIANYLAGGEPDEKKPFELDFVEYTRKYILTLTAIGKTGSAANYRTALNSLVKFAGKEKIDVKEITTAYINKWVAWIGKQPAPKGKRGGRAESLYVSMIQAMHNRAKLEFNDDDEGIVNIPNSPFAKVEVQRPAVTRKRALTKEQILKIFNAEAPAHDARTDRFSLARDVFMLSFFLVGMNSADLYNATDYDGERITYERMKTKDRRADRAEISIKVEPEVRALIEKYRDPDGKRVFCFYKMYTSAPIFNSALNKGLKLVGAQVNISELQFYAARHSWATLAVNEVMIDKFTVHEALNHVDPSMKVTDIYIKKSWKRVDEANRQVLDYVFPKQEEEKLPAAEEKQSDVPKKKPGRPKKKA